jgi:hypothetical protein
VAEAFADLSHRHGGLLGGHGFLSFGFAGFVAV